MVLNTLTANSFVITAAVRTSAKFEVFWLVFGVLLEFGVFCTVCLVVQSTWVVVHSAWLVVLLTWLIVHSTWLVVYIKETLPTPMHRNSHP